MKKGLRILLGLVLLSSLGACCFDRRHAWSGCPDDYSSNSFGTYDGDAYTGGHYKSHRCEAPSPRDCPPSGSRSCGVSSYRSGSTSRDCPSSSSHGGHR